MAMKNTKKWFSFWKTSKASASEVVAPHPDARALKWEEKERVKDEYTNSREYFLFVGNIDYKRHELILLLKAFSQFKKWQRSEMKLIIAGNITKSTEELKQKLATFKYKDDIILVENPEISTSLKLIAACYAFVYLDKKDVFSPAIVDALQSKVPVIVSQSPTLENRLAERGIVISPDWEQLAHQLILLYRNEAFRAEVIARASNNHSPENDDH